MKTFFISLLLLALTVSMSVLMDMLTLKLPLTDALGYLWHSLIRQEYAPGILSGITLAYLLFKLWYKKS